MRTQLLLVGVMVGCMATTSCSKGPEPPRPGTAAFIWNAANSTFHSGDFIKTGENLQQLVKTDGEFTAKARPWAVVISAGLAKGYIDAAEAYDTGAKANRPNPMPFRKEASQLRSLATAAAMEFAEGAHILVEKEKSPEVILAFESPNGNAAQPAAYQKVSAGAWIQDSEREALLTAMLQRGVLLTAGMVAGSPEDPAKTAATLKNGDARRPRADVLFAVAKLLYEQSDLFGPKKLDQPNRLKMLCQQALDALKEIPENKDTKALVAKIEASLKKIRATT
jgi:hypothetical protein